MMMFKKNLLFVLFFITIVFASFSNTNEQTLFENANADFNNKKYDEAIEKYESILKNGMESKELYFNMGNCFYKKDKIGKAILNYERALLLNPNDAEVLNNLKLTQEKRLDEIEVLPDFFLLRGWKNIRQLLSSSSWSFLAVILLWIGIGGLVLWLLGKTRAQRKKGFAVGIGFLLLSLLPFALSYSSAEFEKNSKMAIIMNNKISLKSGADEISTEILKINEGTKVKIQEKVSNWYKVRLENGEVGWLPESVLEEI